jgi:hypothetical protein
MAPGSAFRQSLAFLFKRTLSFDHCLAKVLPGRPTPTGGIPPVKTPGVRTQTDVVPRLRESSGKFSLNQRILGLTIATVEKEPQCSLLGPLMPRNCAGRSPLQAYTREPHGDLLDFTIR